MKKNFHVFMMGTHPRLGEDSPVRRLAGQVPVIHLLHSLCQIENHRLDDNITRLNHQVVGMVSLCKTREFLVLFMGQIYSRYIP